MLGYHPRNLSYFSALVRENKKRNNTNNHQKYEENKKGTEEKEKETQVKSLFVSGNQSGKPYNHENVNLIQRRKENQKAKQKPRKY